MPEMISPLSPSKASFARMAFTPSNSVNKMASKENLGPVSPSLRRLNSTELGLSPNLSGLPRKVLSETKKLLHNVESEEAYFEAMKGNSPGKNKREVVSNFKLFASPSSEQNIDHDGPSPTKLFAAATGNKLEFFLPKKEAHDDVPLYCKPEAESQVLNVWSHKSSSLADFENYKGMMLNDWAILRPVLRWTLFIAPLTIALRLNNDDPGCGGTRNNEITDRDSTPDTWNCWQDERFIWAPSTERSWIVFMQYMSIFLFPTYMMMLAHSLWDSVRYRRLNFLWIKRTYILFCAMVVAFVPDLCAAGYISDLTLNWILWWVPAMNLFQGVVQAYFAKWQLDFCVPVLLLVMQQIDCPVSLDRMFWVNRETGWAYMHMSKRFIYIYSFWSTSFMLKMFPGRMLFCHWHIVQMIALLVITEVYGSQYWIAMRMYLFAILLWLPDIDTFKNSANDKHGLMRIPADKMKDVLAAEGSANPKRKSALDVMPEKKSKGWTLRKIPSLRNKGSSPNKSLENSPSKV